MTHPRAPLITNKLSFELFCFIVEKIPLINKKILRRPHLRSNSEQMLRILFSKITKKYESIIKIVIN